MTMCSRPSAPPAVEAEALAALSDSAAGASHAFVEDGVEVLLVYSKEVSRCLLNLGAHSPRNSPLPWKPAVVEQRNREDERRRLKFSAGWRVGLYWHICWFQLLERSLYWPLSRSSQHSDKQNIDGYRELKNIMVLCGLSGIHGWGLFAASNFQEGQMI